VTEDWHPLANAIRGMVIGEPEEIALEALAANVAAIIADAPSRLGATAFFQRALQVSSQAHTQLDREGA
jgi:hypothetical protein